MDSTRSISEARKIFPELVNGAVNGDVTVITRKSDGAAAAIVPMEMLEAFEEAADLILEREALEILANEPERFDLAHVLAEVFRVKDREPATRCGLRTIPVEAAIRTPPRDRA